MASDNHVEVYRQHRAAQEKYIYFLLAAVGAAIALALTQTQGAKLAWSQTLLGAAVVLWGLSFYFGCTHLGYVESTLYANMALLRMQAGEDPEIGQYPQMMAAATSSVRRAIEGNSNKARLFARLQFGCFIAGSLGYIAWHIFEMWLRAK